MERIYFDYNASAPLAEGLKERMVEWMTADHKNPNSAHQDGQASKALMETSRKTHARLLGMRPTDKLFFNSGGTESNNTVLHSAYHQRGEKNVLVLTRVEHSCVYNYANVLKDRGDIELRYIDVARDGQIDLEAFEKLLDDKVFLVTVMLAQNETGFVFPVKEMAKIAHAKGVPIHSDVVCALAKMPVSFEDLDVDYLTFSSHKFGGLKGIGGVIYKGEHTLMPYIYGGPQEFEKRAGTQNVHGIASSAYALEEHLSHMEEKIPQFVQYRSQLKQAISEIYPEAVFIESTENLPQTLSVSFVGLSGNMILTNLDLEGVSVSYGSACASGSLEISRVMRELGLKINESRATIRISFGGTSTEKEIQEFGVRLKRVVERMN